jgi:hypothetical protein
MSILITTGVVGNVQAMELIGALEQLGIPRERIRVCEPATGPEHGHDAYEVWSGTWGLRGAMLGLAAGWLVMWTFVPWIGGLWGAVVGAICGARYGGYAVAERRTRSERLPLTRVEIEIDDAELARQVRRLCVQRESDLSAVASCAGAGPPASR